MALRTRLIPILTVTMMLACSSGGNIISNGADSTDSASAEVQRPLDVEPARADSKGDARGQLDLPLDLPEADLFAPCQGSGCPGAPCDTNDDCDAGVCTLHLGELVCSTFCVEDCPEGWSCKPWGSGPDGTYACLSDHSHLCQPCTDANSCSGDGLQNVCAVYPGQGTFCGALCDADHLCPEGYCCQEILSTEGTTTKQCVALAGVCSCTQTAVALALATPCTKSNELGTCSGLRVCTDAGLTDCDAKLPAPEVCNGLDDDCDGTIDDVACDDGNDCTEDTCDPVAGCSQVALDGPSCNDLDKCTTGDTCVAGLCVGTPVKCNDGNPCTDDLCDELTGCTFPDNTSPCDDDNPCTLADQCQEGTCVPGPAITCNDNNPCTADICDAAAGCLYQPIAGPCSDGNPCTVGDQCQKGQCAWQELLNCDDGNLCTTDGCDPLLGCVHEPNTLPCNDNSLCTLGDVCAGGECKAGATLNCNDSNPCTDDLCNPLVGCTHTFGSAPCDDLDPCTVTDICSSGSCVGTGLADCNDNNPCTDDFCSPMAGCSHQANTAPCDDGNLCTLADQCHASTCKPGALLVCNDNNPCTKDACLAGQGCTFTPQNGTCDDGNQCTFDDHCSQGKCTSDQPVECDDGNPCTTDVCLPGGGCTFVPNQASCDDGDLCTTGDICQLGECVSGAAIGCDDGNLCTIDSCLAGQCQHAPADLPCDDANACTVGDTCQGGTCKGTFSIDCNDDNLCTSDFCDPTKGCTYVLNNAPCDDGNICTLTDQCSGGECVSTGTMNCNDNNPCTADQCLPDSGCSFAPNQAECDDGNICTQGDVCANGACTFSAFNPCDDDNVCTVDSCHPLLGCQHVPVSGSCDDNDACTTQDLCADGLCVGGAAPDCDDQNACTEDACLPDTGCTHPPVEDATPCDDGDACTATDLCQAGSCQGSDPVTCDDSNDCTDDACDSQAGCLYVPISPCCGNNQVEAGEQCDDGNATGGDGCSATCQNESPCPNGTAYVNGYCWVKAIAHKESHSAACSRVGKSATAKEVAMTWDNNVLTQIAATWGFTSIGDYNNSAHAMWCNNSAQHCGTHNWGSPYDNYGPYGDSAYWPVYTCHP